MDTRIALLRTAEMPRPYTKSRPLQIVNATLDDVGENEVLIKVLAAGICHSDLSVVNGDRPRPTPLALGHEAAGEVVQTGKGISDLASGQRVSMVFVPSCGCCKCCAEGRPSLCEPGLKHNSEGTLLSGTTRLWFNGERILHHLGISCFSDYAICHRRSLIPIDFDVDPCIQAVFGCAVLTGCGAVLNTANLRLGEQVGIVGLGGVGLAGLLGARAGGARTIVAIDTNLDKRDIALELGADHFVDARDPEAAQQVKSLTKGGVELCAEFTGVISALELAIESTRRGGRTVTASLPNPKAILSLAPASLVTEERTLMGSYVGSCIPSRDIPNFLSLYKKGRLPVDKLISHKLKLDSVNEAMDRLANGEAIRQVIQFP